MFSTFAVQRLSAGSIYKLFFIGLVTSLGTVGLVLGVLAFFGFDTVSWNGQQVYGFSAILAGIFLGLFLALFFGVILGSACVVGLWLYSKFRPLSLTGKNLNPSCKDVASAASPPNLG